MAEDHRETRFDKTVTLEDIREKIELFAKERELTEDEKVHLGEELSDVLIYLVRLAGSSLYFCSHF